MSSTAKDTIVKHQRISKSTIFTGLLLFLGLSWILSQTTVVHKFKQHFPSTTEEEMSNKRTVGYFVCRSYSSRDDTDYRLIGTRKDSNDGWLIVADRQGYLRT
jgi:hypothetical protein